MCGADGQKANGRSKETALPGNAAAVTPSLIRRQQAMTKRLKRTERRASILAVAKVLFAERGYHGVSVDDIARRLGVSPAVLYQHFRSKEALYRAVVDTISSTRENYIEAVLDGPLDFASVLKRMTGVFIRSVAADPDYLRMEMLAALEDNPAARQFFQSRWKPFVDYIEASVDELARENRIPQLQPKIASLMFQGIIREALYAKCITGAEHYRQFELESLVDHLIEAYLRAIGYQHQQGGK